MGNRNAVCRFLPARAAISSAQQTVISDSATKARRIIAEEGIDSTRMSGAVEATNAPMVVQKPILDGQRRA